MNREVRVKRIGARGLHAALVAGAVVLLILGTLVATHLFPPGPVSAASPRGQVLGGYRSHAEFEKECSLCHSWLGGADADRCEKCHGQIVQDRRENVGVHGRLPGTETCETCHKEHQGREGVLNRLPMLSFDHGLLSGFSLIKHRSGYDGQVLTCESCHGQGPRFARAVDCVTCHAGADRAFMQDHEAQFGSQCSGCHDGRDRMENFQHSLGFVLDGAHEALDCEACHPNRSYLDTCSDCSACHSEPTVHQGQFGTRCQWCHLTSGWVPAELRMHGFPLDHGGQELACTACHIGGEDQSYTEYACIECHEHDPRQLQGIHAARGLSSLSGCAICHPTGRRDETGQTPTDPVALQIGRGGSCE